MSWFQKNYEKAAIGGAAVAALGLAFFGWSKVGQVDEDFNVGLKGSGNSDPSVRDADKVSVAISSLGLDRTIQPAEIDGRPVDLFTGIPLFIKRDAPQTAIDLLKDEPVHPPIPNKWWIDNRLDPGFADSPQRDPDADGFNNLEEFQAKTNPNDPKSHPPLLAKLMYQKDESLSWVLRPGFDVGEGAFTFVYKEGNGQQNRATAAAPVKPGDIFFDKGAGAKRFKLLGSEKRMELNKRINEEMEVTYVRIEDQRPNKKGMVYELPQFSEGLEPDFLKYDRTAVLTLEAIGLGGEEFKVEENTAFALPPKAASKDYFLKSVTPEAIEVEHTDAEGNKTTITINKGAMPRLNP